MGYYSSWVLNFFPPSPYCKGPPKSFRNDDVWTCCPGLRAPLRRVQVPLQASGCHQGLSVVADAACGGDLQWAQGKDVWWNLHVRREADLIDRHRIW
jgi:hypothetical protein